MHPSQPPQYPRVSPYRPGHNFDSGHFRSPRPPHPYTPRPRFSTPFHRQQTPPLLPATSFPPPSWRSSSPSSPSFQYTSPPIHQPYLPNPATPFSPCTPQGQSPYFSRPDMPSPLVPPHKRPRFTPRGRGSGRYHHNRSFQGHSRRGRSVGIDAYYDQSMFEDPWKELLPPQEGDKTEIHISKEEESDDKPHSTEGDGAQVKGEETTDGSQNTSPVLITSPKLASDDVCGGSSDDVEAVT